MKRSAKWLGNLGVLVALAAGLVVWIMLPWWGVLAVAVLLGLWLALTRSGRLALAATRVGIASLPQRWGASSVIIVGIAGVVGVLVAMLAMGEGFGGLKIAGAIMAEGRFPTIAGQPASGRGQRRRHLDAALFAAAAAAEPATAADR